jgi:ribosome-associated protein
MAQIPEPGRDVDVDVDVDVEITSEPVELYKILKFEGLVASGGEAKAVIAGGLVQVNGERETRKRRKIVAGDTIAFGAVRIKIRLA